jgi:3-dehydro-L-gulonate 2-dehydrogenase
MRVAFEEVEKVLAEKLQSRGCSVVQSIEVGREMARNSLEGTYTHGIN